MVKILDVKPTVCFPFLKYLKIKKKNALYLFCIIVYEE